MKRLTFSIAFVLAATGLSAQIDSTAFMKKLCSISEVSNVVPAATTTFKEKYVMKMEQQVDWKTKAHGTFGERIIVGLKGEDKPTVLVTEGYFADYGLRDGYEEELSQMFDANVVLCEYRYFAESTPQPTNWDYMTVDNSLADYHHVRQTLGQIFKGKWISTGISKGGQTTMFYRSYFPDDVDISVPYVAPLNRSVEDGRHEKFLQYQVSTKENRQKVLDLQLLLFKRKAALLPMLEKYCKDQQYTFNVPIAEIFDFTVMEYSFAFWQWGDDLAKIPTSKATDKELFDYLMRISEPGYFSNQNPNFPFNYQAARELGYYGYYTEPFKKYLSIKSAKGYLKRLMVPKGQEKVQFSPALYNHTVEFLTKNDPKMVYIYGDIDPWSASGVYGLPFTQNKKNLHVYMCKGGSHRTRINSFPEATRQEIIQLISNWLKE